MAIYDEVREGKPTGRLVIEVQVNKVRHRYYETDRRKALRIQAQLKAGIIPQRADEVTPETYTCQDLLQDCKGLWRGKDARGSYMRLERAVEVLGPATRVQRLNLAALEDFMRKLKALGLSGSTCNRYITALAAAMKYAHQKERINTLPRAWPREKEGEARDQFVDERMERAILTKLDEYGRTDEALVVRLLVTSGIRIGEYARLTAEHIDVEEGLIYLENRKNGESHWHPIHPALAGPVADLLERGGPSYRSVWMSLRKACRDLGFTGITPHVLRHTVATRLAHLGATGPQIQNYLGHKSFSTTERYIKKTVGGRRDTLKLLVQA